MKRICAVVAMVVAVAASAAEKVPIHAVPTRRPTAQEVLDLFSRGVRLEVGDVSYFFSSKDLAMFGTSGVPYLACEEAAPVHYAGRSVWIECWLARHGGDGTATGRVRRRLTVEVVSLSADVMVIRQDESWSPPWSGDWGQEAGRRGDAPEMRGPYRLLDRTGQVDAGGASRVFVQSQDELPAIELIPGAQDRTLFEAVKSFVQTPRGAASADPHFLGFELFEGPQAREPRTESEIYYATGADKAAEEVAAALAPVVGLVTPKPWPGGKWDYDVVVVVGQRRAQRP